jgi:hypothetical protein
MLGWGNLTGTVSNSESGPPLRPRLVRRTQGVLGLRVLQLDIGRQRAKSVQQSGDSVVSSGKWAIRTPGGARHRM